MPRILVVDDDSATRSDVCRTLRHIGHEVEEARNGFEAIDALGDGHADLVLIDIIMPGKDGIETIIELRKQNLHMPIIAMSDDFPGGTLNFLGLAKKLGANYALTKPFARAELLDLVDRALKPRS